MQYIAINESVTNLYSWLDETYILLFSDHVTEINNMLC